MAGQGYPVYPPQQLRTSAGIPAVGWKVNTFVAGTTTPLETFSEPTLTTSNGTQIVSDANGFIRCYVAKGVLIKWATTDENDVPQPQYSFDNEEAMVDPTGGSTPAPTDETGVIKMWGTTSAPTGYLICDGSLVSRATFDDLFAVIGTTFGAGDGSTTFQLPDLRGRFPLGKAASGTGSTLGGTGGAIDHTHTGPSHTHTVTVTASGWGSQLNAPSTTGRVNVGDAGGAGQFSSSYQPTADLSLTSSAGGTGATGTNNPPFQALVFIIKT